MVVAWFFAATALAAPEASRSSPMDSATAGLIRSWLVDEPPPQSDAVSSAAAQASPSVQSLDQWRRYVAITAIPSETEREKALNALYSETDSELLRSRILDLIQHDPAFQSQQAAFIRRYGFYANGFNRVFYSAGRVIQGNIQSILQLGIDAVAGLTSSSEADAETRRAYQKLQQHIARSNDITPEDRKQLETLRKQVDQARAAEDMDRAHYALATGDPEIASFYAAQAAVESPDKGSALKLKDEADADAARLRRDAIASTQVGFPDRTPHYKKAPPELLRRLIADEPVRTSESDPGDALVADLMKPIGDGAKSRTALLRDWDGALAAHPQAPEAEQRWAAATLDSPVANPDVRLAEARSRRKGQVLSYVFVGPEAPRQQAYKAASWTAQSYQALQNIGFFYVFEVIGRTASLFWAPPTPEAEYIDAQAAWLRQAGRPYDDEARQVAQSLAGEYQDRSRFADARRVLSDTEALPPDRAKALDREEARRLVAVAEQTTDEAQRKALLDRAQTLAPDVAASAQIKPPPKPEPRKWSLTWDALQRWSGRPLPCDLPGAAGWFDGRADNGEISMEGVLLEETATSGTLRVTYPVLYPDERRAYQGEVAVEKLSPQLRSWLELSQRQESGAAATIKRLDRLPFPFAIEGDAGASGVGLYPTLKPIPAPEEDLDLYQ